MTSMKPTAPRALGRARERGDPDWERIVAEYRDPAIPVVRIVERHGIDRGSLARRLRALGVPPRSRSTRVMAERRAALRLRRMAERIRADLDKRLKQGDAFAGRDNPAGMLLKLTQVTERIAALDRVAGEPAMTAAVAAADRAIIERYVAWRLRAHGIEAGVEGVPAPVEAAATDGTDAA